MVVGGGEGGWTKRGADEIQRWFGWGSKGCPDGGSTFCNNPSLKDFYEQMFNSVLIYHDFPAEMLKRQMFHAVGCSTMKNAD